MSREFAGASDSCRAVRNLAQGGCLRFGLALCWRCRVERSVVEATWSLLCFPRSRVLRFECEPVWQSEESKLRSFLRAAGVPKAVASRAATFNSGNSKQQSWFVACQTVRGCTDTQICRTALQRLSEAQCPGQEGCDSWLLVPGEGFRRTVDKM